MTDHEGNRKIYLTEGFRRVWKQPTIARGETEKHKLIKHMLFNLSELLKVTLRLPCRVSKITQT